MKQKYLSLGENIHGTNWHKMENSHTSRHKLELAMNWKCFTLLIVLLVQSKTSESLDPGWIDATDGLNCTRFIRNSTLNCLPWYQFSNNTHCKAGQGLKSVVFFQKHTGQTWLHSFYCMTTSENITKRRDVIGSCQFSTKVIRVNTMYYPLPCNISELNDYMCADLNRKGQLCGKCNKNYAPAVYSYTLNCVNCTEYSYNGLKYFAVAFGPLTLFCVLVAIFHISATSPYLHGFIFFGHILCAPPILRYCQNFSAFVGSEKVFLQVLTSILGIWNLDFFRLVYEPFCIHPNMTVLQALTLDYAVAFYPLVLVCVSFFLVSLHSRNCKLIVVAWKPFRKILRRFLRNLNIKTSLIESFATLYLLSVVKFQSVTLDLLAPTAVYFVDSKQDSSLYLYLAGDVVYFGKEHMPYAVLAIIVFTVAVLLPPVLLFLYPCNCFQYSLNKLKCNSLALRTFMDVFQGHYKNGTNRTLDLRLFSGMYLLSRFVFIVLFYILNSYYIFIVLGTLQLVLIFFIATLQPQRTKLHYVLDLFFVMSLIAICFAAMSGFLGTDNTIPSSLSRYIGFITVALPFLYIMFLIIYWVVFKMDIPQKILRQCTCINTYINIP